MIQKIKQEIERRVENMISCPFKTAELGSERFNDGELHAYGQILQFIDSLQKEPKCIYNKTLDERKKFCKYCSAFCTIGFKEEPVSEGLEEAARHYLLHEHISPLNDILHQADLKTEMQYHKDIEDAYKAGAKNFKGVYNPYKATVLAIAAMAEKYADGDLKDFYDNVAVKCRDAIEYERT